jgi:hypothetical protein
MQQKNSDKVFPSKYYISAIVIIFPLQYLTRALAFRFSINLII